MKTTQIMITEMLAPMMRYASDRDVQSFMKMLNMMIVESIDTADDHKWRHSEGLTGAKKLAKRASADMKTLRQMRKAIQTRLSQCIKPGAAR